MVSECDFNNVTCVLSCNTHCKGFFKTRLTFEAPRSLIPLLFSIVICVCLPVVKAKSDSRRLEEYMLLIQASLCYILKHLEDRKAWYVHIYYAWCDIILIFTLHRRTRLMPHSPIHSLKIRMMSHLCDKYEHTTLSYLLKPSFHMIVDDRYDC